MEIYKLNHSQSSVIEAFNRLSKLDLLPGYLFVSYVESIQTFTFSVSGYLYTFEISQTEDTVDNTTIKVDGNSKGSVLKIMKYFDTCLLHPENIPILKLEVEKAQKMGILGIVAGFLSLFLFITFLFGLCSNIEEYDRELRPTRFFILFAIPLVLGLALLLDRKYDKKIQDIKNSQNVSN